MCNEEKRLKKLKNVFLTQSIVFCNDHQMGRYKLLFPIKR